MRACILMGSPQLHGNIAELAKRLILSLNETNGFTFLRTKGQL